MKDTKKEHPNENCPLFCEECNFKNKLWNIKTNQ